MYKLEDIRDIHLELTSKCQARCPMCPRRINGGLLNPLITLNEITLTQFKEWFTIDFIQQLDSLFMCGNLGDPIIAEDCLEIFQYLKETNPNIRLSMHTNGSARNIYWWKELAKYKVKVTFGIDGLEDTHKLYRVNTDWNHIIKNAQAFIEAGGDAEWHMLVFKHNEHQVDTCRELSQTFKFKKFTTKHTSRFKDDKFHVLDEGGKTVNILYPTDISTSHTTNVLSIASAEIQCKATKYNQIYVSANGGITPCCWLDFSWQLPNQDNRIDYMDAVGIFPNLNKNTMKEIFDLGYFKTIEDSWASKPLIECSKQCGKFDKLGAQFVSH
jgi:MoaA/NifB/PqqE/SkfB family radical SAM enzyme